YVQVAAVTRQEDADSLVEALKKKQYPAFIAGNSAADKFFHVQVGPYADVKDADAMRARLISDGYNPIVKK
ncbi:MAG: SPOR domain-containing protein, partial [Terriglobales bacterium]